MARLTAVGMGLQLGRQCGFVNWHGKFLHAGVGLQTVALGTSWHPNEQTVCRQSHILAQFVIPGCEKTVELGTTCHAFPQFTDQQPVF